MGVIEPETRVLRAQIMSLLSEIKKWKNSARSKADYVHLYCSIKNLKVLHKTETIIKQLGGAK